MRRTLALAFLFLTATLPSLADEPFADEIRAFEEQDRQAMPEPGAILFVGSSSIRMWTDLAKDFPDARVIDRGFGGSQIREVTGYVDRIVKPYRPSAIVLYAGDNDLAAGRTPQQVVEDFQSFVYRVRQDLPDVRIEFVSIKPSPARAQLIDAMREANRRVALYCSMLAKVGFIDVFTPMLDEEGKPRAELFGPDGLHMNRKGYDLWKEAIGGAMPTAAALRYRTTAPGHGPGAKAGDTVRIQETVALPDGTVVFESRDKGGPIPFTIGDGHVITGVDQGVRGMKVGERRRLTIPPELSKRTSYPPNVPPDATLRIDVDLVEIVPREDGPAGMLSEP